MKKNIAILMGGNSSEVEISIQSGNQIFDNIDRNKYNPYKVLLKGKDWLVSNELIDNVPINKNNFSIILQNQEINFDCVFIIIHGTPGEDGKLQGYFDLLDIPYTTSGVLTSALTFDKFACKNFLNAFNILSPKSILISKSENISPKYLTEIFDFPFIIKPNNGGSSFGISIVNSFEEITLALQKAFSEDTELIIEEYIAGIELTCGLFKTKKGKIILPITEIVSKNAFFDYEAKYTPEMADEIIPARISNNIKEKCEKISSLIYDNLNCKGVVRIDYILKDNNLYFLEVNTIPGMSKNSIVPRQAKAHGISLEELVSILIENSFI